MNKKIRIMATAALCCAALGLSGCGTSQVVNAAKILTAPNEALDVVVDGAAAVVSENVAAELNAPTSVVPGCETTGSGLLSSFGKAAIVATGVGTGLATSGAALPFLASLAHDYLGCAFLSTPENQTVSMWVSYPALKVKMDPSGWLVHNSSAGVSSFIHPVALVSADGGDS